MKRVIREACILAALAVVGVGAFRAWQQFWVMPPSQRLLAERLAQPSPQAPSTPHVAATEPNRTLPVFTPIENLPIVPEQPGDDDIVGSRVFANRLWPVDGLPGAGGVEVDNSSLGELLRRIAGMEEREKFAALEDWLQGNGNSRWALALRSELMGFKFKTGWFDDARRGWDQVWQTVKSRTDLPAYHLGNDVLAHLLDATVGASRADQLRELVAEAEKRPLNGALEGKVFRAKEMVWLLEHTAAQNVMCGPLALNAIKEFKREPFVAPRLAQVPPEFQATGIPLAEVQRLARNDYSMELTMVRRTDPKAKIPTPAVMHVKDDHFNALLATSGDGKQYFLEDRTLNFTGWVDKESVDGAASGYFLVASNETSNGWDQVDSAVGNTVFGRDGAHGTVPTDESTGDEDPKTGDEDGQCSKGMPRYTFHPIPGAVRIGDIPLTYSPPVGPPVVFKLNYNDMDSGAPASPPTWSHVGLTWSTHWVAWVEHVPGTLTNSSRLRVRVPGGGTQVMTYSTDTARFGPHDQSFATVVRSGTYTYTRELPDGSKEIYNAPNSPTSPTRIFLSQIIDPQGNALTLAYDSSVRLVSVTDTIGQVTNLFYTDTGNVYRITQVRDPFGRTCALTYDTGGRLISTTDQLGLTSTFAYGSDGFISSMTTPYGSTTFSKPIDYSGSQRIVEVTDPAGGKERVEYNDTGNTSIPSLRPPATNVQVAGQSVNFYAENTRLQFRNAWYWDKLANEVAPGDYSAARNYRFFTDRNWVVVPVVEAIKPAGQDRIWFNYPGGVESPTNLPYYKGTSAAPEKIQRVLPDGTPQLTQTQTNFLGNITKMIDPLGRTTESLYAANGVDLTEIRQTTGGVNERQLAITYNAQHLPLTVTDAAGSVTTFTYNARGQVLTVRNALNQTTTFTYNANGYLTTVNGPLTGNADSTTLTYDSVGRVRTTTDPDTYTQTFSYDNFDRVTRIDYPDGTYEAITYDKLDRASVRDRLGRVTTYAHNAVQQMVSVTDPLNRTVGFDWCRCGSLSALTDPMGRVTRWKRNFQGQVVAKIYADNSQVGYEYDSAGRMLRQTDEKGQFKAYEYNIDNSVRKISYPNAKVPTPSVSYEYDSKYPRITRMEDGIGTTLYAYHAVTGGVAAGAGQLASVDGPWANDTITTTYDALGRETNRAINGVAETATFDAAGRPTGITNPLGTFTYAYDGPTARVLSATHNGGTRTLYDYYSNAQDRRIQRIRNLKPDGTTPLSVFEYSYDTIGRILTWKQQQDSDTANAETWTLGYDNTDQLTSNAVSKAGANVSTSAWEYDPAANRTKAILNGRAQTASYNALNQLTNTAASAPAATYEWDAENRLIAINQGTNRSEFTYDGYGRRVRIVEKVSGVTVSTDSYLWCGLEECEKRDATGNSVRQRYYAQGFQGVSGSATGTHLYLTDHLGSIRELTDTSGVLKERIAYDAWGMPSVSNATPLASFAYTGHYWHAPSRLSLAPYRAYSAVQGRWMSRDPIGEIGGINPYGYVANNPIGYVDPTGEFLFVPILIRAGVYIIRAAGQSAIELALQLWEHDGNIDCVDWWQVGYAAATGSFGKARSAGGLAKAAATTPLWSSTKTNSAVANGFKHWQKHGKEFLEFQNSKQYVEGAKNFFGSPPSGTLTKMRPNGDKLFYNPSSNTFGVQAADGAPRTMFRPEGGINYWNKL